LVSKFHLANIIFSSLFLSLLLISSGQSQQCDTLRIERVVADVLKNNDRLASARYMEASVKAKVGINGAWDDPMLMLGVQNLPTNFDFKMDPMTMKMIGLSQNIPIAGQKGLQTKASKAEAEISTDDRMMMQIDVITSVKSAYADLYYRSQALNDLTSQLELLEDIISTTRSRLEVNQATQEEYLSAQSELWRMQTQILMTKTEVNDKWNQIQAMRGLAYDSVHSLLEEPKLDSIPSSPELWFKLASEHYPQLKKLSHQSQQYGYEAQAANRMRWPMLNIQATYGIRTGFGIMADGMPVKRDNMLGFQAGITLPIFAGHQQKKMAISMDAMKRSAEAETIQLQRDIETRLRTLHETANALLQNIKLYRERIIPADEDALKGALAGYTANRLQLTGLLSYTLNIYRDRLAEKQLANQLAQTMTEVSKYISDPAQFAGRDSDLEK
jgi:outer membrane protein, heavy metal efflux system